MSWYHERIVAAPNDHIRNGRTPHEWFLERIETIEGSRKYQSDGYYEVDLRCEQCQSLLTLIITDRRVPDDVCERANQDPELRYLPTIR